MTLSELDRMRKMSLKNVDRKKVIEFGEIKVDTSAPIEERVLSILDRNINPYFRKTKDGCIIKISFSNNGTTFQDNFLGVFSKKV